MNFKKILVKIFSVILLIYWLWYLFYWNPFISNNVGNKNISEIWDKIEIPGDDILDNMLIETLLLFNEGFKNKNLEKLYNKSSEMIKNMYTLKEFNEIYIKGLNKNIIFNTLSIENIKISSKTKISNKTILLKWYLNKKYLFDIYFYYNGKDWKNSWITIYPELIK